MCICHVGWTYQESRFLKYKDPVLKDKNRVLNQTHGFFTQETQELARLNN